MSTILIGVDGSARSEDAVAFARRLAGATTGRVIVACAFPYSDGPSRSANRAYRNAIEQDARRTAERMSGLLELPDDRVEIVTVADPSAARALHELAEREHAAIVVAGHTRSGRAGRIFPGATAERLLHGAPCAVAVVPEGYQTRTGGVAGRVGAAYVDTPEARAALAAAVPVARALHARLEVVGVVPDELSEVPPLMGEPAAATVRAHVRDRVQAQLEQVASGLREDVWAEAVRLDGEPAEQLAAHSAGLDLLFMGSRGYGPLRSVIAGGVSGRVTRAADCPVIVVPRGVAAPLAALFGGEATVAA